MKTLFKMAHRNGQINMEIRSKIVTLKNFKTKTFTDIARECDCSVNGYYTYSLFGVFKWILLMNLLIIGKCRKILVEASQ